MKKLAFFAIIDIIREISLPDLNFFQKALQEEVIIFNKI